MSTALQDAVMDGISEGTANNYTIHNGNKRPAPLTHDVSLVGEHAPDIKSVAKRLQAAVDESWPTRGQSRYTQVHVLMLSWEDDDLDVILEIEQLGAIFQASYHYAVQSWRIPRDKPVTRLQVRLAEFLKHDGPETLLIIYYAGHAIQDEQRSDPPVWASRRDNPARLPSITVQSILSECDSDVLLLYDCCHAIPTTTGITGCGVKEFLAACGFESIAPEVGQDSFTNALIQELGRASYSSISVGELYGHLIDRLRTWKPCISKNEFGQMRFNSRGKPLYERSKRKTPIHCALTNEQKRRSIILSPLPAAFGNLGLSILSGSSSAQHPRKKKRYTNVNEEEDQYFDTEDTIDCPQVIISIRVDTEEFDLNSWLEWIKDVPPEATKVKVEGIYGSLSSLLLLRMPITTWSLLPIDTAYSFIGFVTTGNLVPKFQSLVADNIEGQGQHPAEQTEKVASNLTDSIVPPSFKGSPSESRENDKDVVLDPGREVPGSTSKIQPAPTEETFLGNRSLIRGDSAVIGKYLINPVELIIEAFHESEQMIELIYEEITINDTQPRPLEEIEHIDNLMRSLNTLKRSLAQSVAEITLVYSGRTSTLDKHYSYTIQSNSSTSGKLSEIWISVRGWLATLKIFLQGTRIFNAGVISMIQQDLEQCSKHTLQILGDLTRQMLRSQEEQVKTLYGA